MSNILIDFKSKITMIIIDYLKLWIVIFIGFIVRILTINNINSYDIMIAFILSNIISLIGIIYKYVSNT